MNRLEKKLNIVPGCLTKLKNNNNKKKNNNNKKDNEKKIEE